MDTVEVGSRQCDQFFLGPLVDSHPYILPWRCRGSGHGRTLEKMLSTLATSPLGLVVVGGELNASIKPRTLAPSPSVYVLVSDWHFRHLPDVIWGHAYAADGDIGMRLCAPDGSGAEAWHTPTDDGFLIRQAGPRRLWDRVEQAAAFWQQAGQPPLVRTVD